MAKEKMKRNKNHYLEFTTERFVSADDLAKIKEAPQKSGERGGVVNAHFEKQIKKLKEEYKAKGLFMNLVGIENRPPFTQIMPFEDGFYIRTTYYTWFSYFTRPWSDEIEASKGAKQ